MPYQIMTSSERMPSNCRGRYRRVAVVETETEDRPAMISPRARGVIRIVQEWRDLNEGKTDRCAYQRALAEAEQLLHQLTE